jgi:hypothetical protein
MADEAAEGGSALMKIHNSQFLRILRASLVPNIVYVEELIDI